MRAHLMWQWPSGEMVSWERRTPSRESARVSSTTAPLLAYTEHLRMRAPLPFNGMSCAAKRLMSLLMLVTNLCPF